MIPLSHNASATATLINGLTKGWLSKALRPTNHIIGRIGDELLQIKWPNQQCQSTGGRYGPKN